MPNRQPGRRHAGRLVTDRGKRDILLRAGATHVLAPDEGDVAARLNEITSGTGVNVIFDPVADPLLPELASATARFAKGIIYGALSAGPTPIPALTRLQKRLTIRGYDMAEVVADDTRLGSSRWPTSRTPTPTWKATHRPGRSSSASLSPTATDAIHPSQKGTGVPLSAEYEPKRL
jgi:threonine dehydrogenase-like Zn-dependent dehydrogenase